ncbi:MAG: hypothetical protein KAW46_02725, partial [candidate division Zixibacteria bacterium]|nr:hypothetical protein [candidate division Zixibacteria bacterium]
AEKKKGDVPPRSGLKLVKSEPESVSGERSLSRTHAVNVAMVRAGWEKFVGFLRQKNSMLASQLAMVQIREVKDNQILAVFGGSVTVARQVVEKPTNLSLITECLKDQFAANLSIKFDTERQKDVGSTDTERKRRNGVDVKKLLENSPRLQMLLEKVDGEIIGVRNGGQ